VWKGRSLCWRRELGVERGSGRLVGSVEKTFLWVLLRLVVVGVAAEVGLWWLRLSQYGGCGRNVTVVVCSVGNVIVTDV